MRFLITTTAVAATLLIGAPFCVELAAATPVEVMPSPRHVALVCADRVTDFSARHRYYRYHHRYRNERRYRAALPYDGYPPYYTQPYCHRSYGLPFFGRGW